ncbi:hypothetical protein EVAR_98529_1 [Eumeta japonica]|uniref:Uncharacterized protein n=1 Tax=Eumeta variegata TaxID=151549 RepID=A0A4C1ZWG6_EUMVA|nr:hypothetical protein EVAR_98529_1 [Eumeta japonica]
MEAVEAAIALRQQQLLNKYANIPLNFHYHHHDHHHHRPRKVRPCLNRNQNLHSLPRLLKEISSTSDRKSYERPKEYYPVGYEKNFDDHFQSKVDLPDTNFHCGDQKYFPGLYGDENWVVFHVCALTDDGLVMKSFLCPESTLFDQTILKCNWWFYVDCKNTRKLYETNIPVSKSYQLMKALTFFSNYKKEIQDDGGRPTNPEDIEGINQAITILENQDKKPSNDQPSTLPAIEIIAAQTVDPRNTNAYKDNASDINPIYNHRTNRNYRNQTISLTENSPLNDSTPSSSEIKPVVVKASAEKSISTSSSSSENFSKERNSTVRHANRDRQRQKISVGRPFSLAVTPKFNGESNVKRTRTVVSKAGTTTSTSTTTTTTTTTTPAFVTGSDPKL